MEISQSVRVYYSRVTFSLFHPPTWNDVDATSVLKSENYAEPNKKRLYTQGIVPVSTTKVAYIDVMLRGP